MSLPLSLAIGFLFGIGFGFFIQRAGFCVAHGLGEIFIGMGKRFARLFLTVFVITSVGFLVSGWINPELGLKTVGQIRGAGFYNILSGILFGMGILMTGGCILGTLRQLGEGNLNYLIVLLSFIPGMALVVYGLDPLLEQGYNVQKILLPDLFGVPAAWVTGTLVAAAVLWYSRIRPKKRRAVQSETVRDVAPATATEESAGPEIASMEKAAQESAPVEKIMVAAETTPKEKQ